MTDISTLASGKRPRDADQPDKEDVPFDVGTKKRRFSEVLLPTKLSSKEALLLPITGPDPYRTLPPPTKEWVQLRFQLHHFQGVYRVVQVPTNYTFANLHTLIQYLFGWTGNNSHITRVYTNVEMYKSAYRKGSIKSYGQPPPFPEEWLRPDLGRDSQEKTLQWWNIQYAESAIYEVVAVGKNQGPYKNSRGYFSDYSWHYKAEDNELLLNDVWNLDEEKNVSLGDFSNRNIGLIYEYGLDCPWAVHITIDDGFYNSKYSGNDVFVKEIKGAPSVEEKHNWASDHPEGFKKAVSDLLLVPANWKRYCRNELTTRTRRDELVARVVRKDNMTDQQVAKKQAKLEAQATTIRVSLDEAETERKRQLRAQKKAQQAAAAKRRFAESDSDTPEPELYSSDLYEAYEIF
ncbi:hypothetical protein BDN70DRAFT_924770 [Pholiota conissans]|uniref:Plasmid pRiA4b Orf3-like domain-containing protein n=1 Tax=Pholiota conissans TaxID=109636 RepID=A0A9P6CUS9_9AGAR|nr:hypothetical protein BDN70DRAFT_924770 [Pholiota conissans]